MKKSLEQFLSSIPNANTRAVYSFALRKFLKAIQVKPEEYLTNGERDYEADIEKYFVILSDKDTPPISIRTQLAAIKSFLLDNDIELKQQFWRKINGRIKGKKARFQDEVPENNITLKQIMDQLDARGRALFLMLVSSGMRIGEALKIALSDLEIEREPARITIRGEYTKNGDSRIVFVSQEAKEALKAWLLIRQKRLESSKNRGKGLGRTKSMEDNRVFPLDDSVAQDIWNNALEKAGLTRFDTKVRRRTLHIHVLRKYFRTVMGKINVDYTETLMGHEGYLTGSYRRHSVEEIAKWYLENQHQLYVFTDASEIQRMKVELDKRYQQQDIKLQAIDADKKTMQTLVNIMAEKVESLTTRMTRYEAHVRKWMEMSPEEFDEFMIEFSKKKEQLTATEDQKMSVVVS